MPLPLSPPPPLPLPLPLPLLLPLPPSLPLPLPQTACLKVSIHVYQLNEEGASEEGTDEDDEVVACQQWVLPSREFHGLWPTLIYDHAIKVR